MSSSETQAIAENKALKFAGDGIRLHLMGEQVDLAQLRALCRQKGGLVDNTIRCKVWPKLLNIDRYDKGYAVAPKFRDNHKDSEQIQNDINRSLWHFEHVRKWKATKRESRRRVLSDIIHLTLENHKELHYYQGFHDVAAVFVLVCDDAATAFALTEKVAVHYFSDMMRKDFQVLMNILKLILPLLQRCDPQLFDFVIRSEVQPYFCLSGVVTWFSHDMKRLPDVARLFDVFLSSHPLYSLYFTVSILQFRRSAILQCECEFSEVHNLLCKLPSELPVEDLLQRADMLMKLMPPSVLAKKAEAPLLRDIRGHRVPMFENPTHLAIESVSPDWQLLQQHRCTDGLSRMSRHLRRKRALASKVAADLGLISGAATANDSSRPLKWNTILAAAAVVATLSAVFVAQTRAVMMHQPWQWGLGIGS